MKAFSSLPEGYNRIFSVDMAKDKKMALLINLLSALLSAVLIIPMLFVVPISGTFYGGSVFLRGGVYIVLLIAYIILHELVHGVAMKICGTKKVKYGFKITYAYACSDDYYDKSSYIFIALAPVVLWGIVLAVLNFVVPTEWFWIIYLLQVVNVGGAAGDFYVTFKFSRMPKDILIKDHGVGMNVFSRETL